MKSVLTIVGAAVRQRYQMLIGLLIGLALSSCATTGLHGFAFDMRRDDQNAVVLDYRYGSSTHWIGPTQAELKDGRVFGWESSGAQFSRPPEFLYVKWRNRTTGKVFEDKVDLRNRLPSDLANKEVTFLIKDDRLHVYVVTRIPRPPNTPPNGPRMYWDDIVITIYPDQRAR